MRIVDWILRRKKIEEVRKFNPNKKWTLAKDGLTKLQEGWKYKTNGKAEKI